VAFIYVIDVIVCHTDEQRSSEIQCRVLLIICCATIAVIDRLEPFSQIEFNTPVLKTNNNFNDVSPCVIIEKLAIPKLV
jgi:hypothetical protein